MSMKPNEGPSPFLAARDGRVAVIAGSGRLPANVVDALVRRGHHPLVIGISGEADLPQRPDHYLLRMMPAERLGTLMPFLKREGITHLVFAGGVSRRPKLGHLRLSFDVIRRLPQLAVALSRGDDGLLRAVIGHAEANGIQVVGAHQIVPDLLTPKGVLTKARPASSDRKDIYAGLAAARAIGVLDIGQAAVAIGGRVIALEGVEGTDGLLKRTVELRHHGRLAGKERGVLVKCAKPGQELRADLPAIGPATIAAAHEAGLAGVALEADHSLILDFEETVARADECGLFVIGLEEN